MSPTGKIATVLLCPSLLYLWTMYTIITFRLLLAVVGLIMWLAAGNPVVKEAGKIMFFCGLLAIALDSKELLHLP